MGSRVRPEVQPLSTTGQICNLGQVTWHNEALILPSIKNWKDCIYLQFPERIKQDGTMETHGMGPHTINSTRPFETHSNDRWFFFFFWLHWVCVAARGLLWLQCLGFALLWPLLLQSTGSRHSGFNIHGHGLSYSTTCETLSDQELNLCPLPWWADS